MALPPFVLVWQVIQPLLVIGAGILIGVLLDARVRDIRWLLLIGRAPSPWRSDLGLLGIRGGIGALLSSGSN